MAAILKGVAMQTDKYLTTNEFADSIRVKGSTVRRGLCVNGHYLGIRPIKLMNGRLLWPEVKPEQLQKQAQ
ncbi:MAG: hypothetical protein C4519_18810 [Desulfobacteraceae bacterium]|nr:MAG: hypothetical protein C4519_18810 [Desulfobacteraceae bacterium]